jgi:hypothetical protein
MLSIRPVLSPKLARRAAGQNMRHIVTEVLVGIAHVGPVQDHRVVEQPAVPFPDVLQLLDQVGRHLHGIAVQSRVLHSAPTSLCVEWRAH